MKKMFLLVMIVAIALTTSCVNTNGGHSEITSEYDKFKQSIPPAEWQPTGVRCLDDIGILSAQTYKQTYQYMQEYISATENNREYVGLMNEVDDIKKNEGLDDAAALQKAYNNIAEADKSRPEKPALPRAIEGYNAVQALKPANKIQELTPMLPQIADLTSRAKKLPDEIKVELSDNPFKIPSALKSAQNVLDQLNYSQQMVQYIIIAYNRNQEMKKYMQD